MDTLVNDIFNIVGCYLDPEDNFLFRLTNKRFLTISLGSARDNTCSVPKSRQFSNVVYKHSKTLSSFFHSLGFPFTKFTYQIAARLGNLDNMKWLLENKCPWDEYTFASAASIGNLENMKWLLANKCPWDTYTFDCATRIGNLENIKWLEENNFCINI